MPHTCRYIFNTLTVVSLLLLLATVGLWVDSYWLGASLTHNSRLPGLENRGPQFAGFETIEIASRHGQIILVSAAGLLPYEEEGLIVIRAREPDLSNGININATGSNVITLGDRQIRGGKLKFGPSPLRSIGLNTELNLFLGFGYARNKFTNKNVYSIPHWFLALIFTILPSIWFIMWRKRRNLPDSPCSNCGYDLTGNETGQCPECGVAIKTKAAQI